MHGQGQPLAGQRLHPAALQRVLAVEAQRRGEGQLGSCHAVGKMAGDEVRAGGRAISHGAQAQAVAAGNGAAVTGDRSHHQSTTQPSKRVVLVVNGQIQQPWRGGKGGHDPGRQAVCIDSQAQHGLVRGQFCQTRFQKPDLIQMHGKPQALRRWPNGRSPVDQDTACPILEAADPLRDGRGRDPQRGGCGVKGTAPDDLGQGGQSGIVEH